MKNRPWPAFAGLALLAASASVPIGGAGATDVVSGVVDAAEAVQGRVTLPVRFDIDPEAKTLEAVALPGLEQGLDAAGEVVSTVQVPFELTTAPVASPADDLPEPASGRGRCDGMTTGSGTRPVRVALQQRHELFRSGLALLLGASPAIEVVGSVGTARQILELCARARPVPHVALVDATGADLAEPAALCAALRRKQPGLRVVAVNARGARRLLREGSFDAVVDRDGGVAAIVERLVGLSQQGPAAAPPAPSRRSASAALSARELQVLGWLGRGSTVRDTSERLAISPKTVEHHKRRIFEKLGVQNQAHAVSVALCSGLLAHDLVLERS